MKRKEKEKIEDSFINSIVVCHKLAKDVLQCCISLHAQELMKALEHRLGELEKAWQHLSGELNNDRAQRP